MDVNRWSKNIELATRNTVPGPELGPLAGDPNDVGPCSFLFTLDNDPDLLPNRYAIPNLENMPGFTWFHRGAHMVAPCAITYRESQGYTLC